MPNIQTKSFSHPSYPFSKDGYEFEFATKENKGRSLIKVKHENREFFIEVIKRDDDYLIKAEKLTRFSPVFIIQKALNILATTLDLKLTYSNIESKKSPMHLDKSSEFLKKIDFFVDEFKVESDIAIEIGFGSGRHLLYQAKKNPHILHIGIEIHKPSIEQVIKQCKLQSIDNILLLDYDARIFLELLPSLSVKSIFLHFPVPWDKKPHRRVISERFIDECFRVLQKDGTFELRTDSQNYYEYALSVINSFNTFDLKIRKNFALDVSSKYEDRWKKQEKNIHDVILTNTTPKQIEKKPLKIEFDKELYSLFPTLLKNFKRECIRGENYFINFESILEINENEGVLKVTLGSYEKSEHKYIIFKDKNVQYFPNNILPTKDNFDAHASLIDYIKKAKDVH